MTGITGRASRLLTSALVAAVALAFTAFGWFGYRAVSGWRHSATLLASQRAGEAADRLATALGRDMRGVQATVLSSPQWDQFMLDPPYDVRTLAASAFARYPYPESFFAWRGPAAPPAVVFLNRSDRRPAWMPGAAGPNRFPVIVEYEPAVAGLLMRRIQRDAAGRRRFSVFEMLLGRTRYQVVARLLYRDALREQLEGAFGFTVNLDWARRSYFPDMTRQIARIGGSGTGLALAVLDERGARIAGTSAEALPEPTTRRAFPLFFFDPGLLALESPADLERAQWTAMAAAGADPTLGEALRGSNQTLAIAGIATVILALGLLLTARATRASARLAELRSEFVQTVTHELKTPIASIRARRSRSTRSWSSRNRNGSPAWWTTSWPTPASPTSPRPMPLSQSICARSSMTFWEGSGRRSPRQGLRCAWRSLATSPPSVPIAPPARCCSTTSSTTPSGTRGKRSGSPSARWPWAGRSSPR
jgi:hypothetical protein